jgi:hypothetical protein
MVKNKLEDFISEDGFDMCLLCGITTEYKIDVPANLKDCYVGGMGQLCSDCYVETKIMSIEYEFIKKYLNHYF